MLKSVSETNSEDCPIVVIRLMITMFYRGLFTTLLWLLLYQLSDRDSPVAFEKMLTSVSCKWVLGIILVVGFSCMEAMMRNEDHKGNTILRT